MSSTLQLKLMVLVLFMFCFAGISESSIIFYEDFEAGDLFGWDSGWVDYDCYTDIVTTYKHNGSYSLEAKEESDNPWNPCAIVKYFDAEEAYCRFYIYFPAGFFTGFSDSRVISRIDSAGTIDLWNDSYIALAIANWGLGNKLYLALYPADSSAIYDGLQENTWYCVEIKAPRRETNATVRWWVNGTQQQSIAGDLSSFENWEKLYIGNINGNVPSWNRSIFFDDIVISDTYNGQVPSPYHGNFRFSRPVYIVSEGNGYVNVPVKRLGGSSGAVSVQYSCQSATAGSADYVNTTGVLSWADGNMQDKAFTVTLNNDSIAENTESFFLRLSNPAGGAELGSVVCSTVCIIDNDGAAGIMPNPLISRGTTVYANLNQAAAGRVVDGIYSASNIWQPGGAPAWIAINVGTGYSKLMLTWCAWNPALDISNYIESGGVPADYTVQTSADSTNGSDGAWQTVATVTGNVYKTREHVFDFTGRKWVRFYVTSAPSGWGLDDVEIYDMSGGGDDTHIFLGDSITRGAYNRGIQPGYPENIHTKYPGYFPAMLSGGIGGWLAAYFTLVIDDILKVNPDMKYWHLGLGSNDVKNEGGYAVYDNKAIFKSTMQNLINKITVAGHVPVITRIPYCDTSVFPDRANIPQLNQVIDELTVENNLIPGPDLYAYFYNNKSRLSDGIHPDATGCREMNKEWADAMDGLYTVHSDLTVPANVTAVRDGTGTDIDSTISISVLCANWNASSDAESGILKYLYAIGTTAGGTDVLGWSDNGVSTTVVKTGLSLTIGQKYYFSVKAVNGAGLQSSSAANSDGQTVEQDTTPPGAPAAVRDGISETDDPYTYSTTQLSANWDAATDAQSGISGYQYAIGTAAGGMQTVNWTSTGNATSVTKTGLNLTGGTTYYFSVKAVNGAGLSGPTANSDGQFVVVVTTITPPEPPADTPYPNPVSLTSAISMKFILKGDSGGVVKIFTLSGKLVRELEAESGVSYIEWDGTNKDGEKLTRGVYIYVLTNGNGDKTTGKIAIVK